MCDLKNRRNLTSVLVQKSNSYRQKGIYTWRKCTATWYSCVICNFFEAKIYEFFYLSMNVIKILHPLMEYILPKNLSRNLIIYWKMWLVHHFVYKVRVFLHLFLKYWISIGTEANWTDRRALDSTTVFGNDERNRYLENIEMKKIHEKISDFERFSL